MSNIVPLVNIVQGKALATSLDVAEKFTKRHDTVLRAIRKLDCSDDFRRRNFAESSYLNDQNKKQPMFLISRDGFSFLAMGFTGKEAAAWKEKYITAFNAMESVLLNQSNSAWQELRSQGKATRLEEADTISDFIEYAKMQGSKNAHWYYATITKATYKALFIIKDKSGQSFRDMLDGMQLSFLQTAEYVAVNALRSGMNSGLHYKVIFQLAKSRVEAFAESVGTTPVVNKLQAIGKPVKKIWPEKKAA